MDECASRTKMDSIFISAVNPLSPSVHASFQSLSQTHTHTNIYINSLHLSAPASLKRAEEYFHSRHHLVNSALMGLVHLKCVTVH